MKANKTENQFEIDFQQPKPDLTNYVNQLTFDDDAPTFGSHLLSDFTCDAKSRADDIHPLTRIQQRQPRIVGIHKFLVGR